ncbi:MAG: Trk system potassium transporter TrkA [Hyphomicrobium sp.]|nr:Trk system potassium transporter TrkA [Hyphomicrobium sp.]
MKVLVCGAGQVGYGIAEQLSAEGNDVTLIDVRPDLVQKVNDTLEARAYVGNGAHPDVLERAGARECDMIIAVTLHDEVNMMAAQVAGTLFDVPTKIARVRSQTYLNKEWAKLFSRGGMGIDVIISPEREVGEMVLRRLSLPGAFDNVSFAEGAVASIGLTCDSDCPVIDTPLRQLSELFPDLPAVVVAVQRRGEIIVPHSDDHIAEGDDVYVVTPAEQVARTLSIFGQAEAPTRRVVIAGGGNIGLYVARELERRHTGVRVKIIEASRGRAEEIADHLERTVVLHGSALSEELLREAEIASADTIVALTNDDQVNILACALAKQLGAARSLCLVNSSGYASVIRSFDIDSEINPRFITVSRVLQHVRRGRIIAVHSIGSGAGEIMEAEALETAPIVGKALKDLPQLKGVRVGAIVRGGKVIVPDGDTQIQVKDRVILFARTDNVRDVEQLFRVSIEFF